MYELLGKEFCTQTNKTKDFLDKLKINYKFIDIDFDEGGLNFIKLNKIIGIPVLKKNDFFIVGYNESAIKRLIQKNK